jgi:hypothetical protein
MAKARSGDSAIYNRPLGGGEAIDDDVEGHSMKMMKAVGGPGLRASGDDDVEGHTMKARATRSTLARGSDDEDTEGHRMFVQATEKPGESSARARVSDEGEDTEGHSSRFTTNARARGESSARARVSDEGEDTEGHQRAR